MVNYFKNIQLINITIQKFHVATNFKKKGIFLNLNFEMVRMTFLQFYNTHMTFSETFLEVCSIYLPIPNVLFRKKFHLLIEWKLRAIIHEFWIAWRRIPRHSSPSQPCLGQRGAGGLLWIT